MIKIKVTLNRNGHLTKKGERTIVISIYKRPDRVVINTGIRVKEEDFKDGEVLPSCPYYQSYNNILINAVKKLLQIYDERVRNDQFVSPASIREAYLNNMVSTVSLKEWVESIIYKSNREMSTKRGYTALLKHIFEFSKNEDIKLAEINNYYFVTTFIEWMQSVKKLAKHTIVNREKMLSCLLHEAANHKIIKADDNPFNIIKIPEIAPKVEFIDWDDIKSLGELQIDDPKKAKVRDAFLFCCFTGLRFGDFHSLRSAFLDKNYVLEVDQGKTGHLVKIPLKELFRGRPLELLEKYRTLENFSRIGCNSKCNKDIQEIARMAKIEKKVHWHVARHTCATLLNKAGLQMHEIQMILGHQRLSTTSRIYAHTLIDQIQDSLKRQFLKLDSKIQF